MSEIAIVTAKQSRLTSLAAEGRAGAAVAVELARDPTQFLSTVQIGITSIGIMNGIFGESVLAEPFALWLQKLGLAATTSSSVATVLVVVVVTYVSIVVGELVPKRIGQVAAERIACAIARPMGLLATATRPFVLLLTHSTHAVLRLLPFRNSDNQSVTEEDIQAMLSEGSESGIINKDEHQIVRNVLRLDESHVSALMVPRSDITFLDTCAPLEDNYQRLLASNDIAIPVCDRQVENLLGVVTAKDLLAAWMSGQPVDLAALAKPCNFVLESLTALELLGYFKSSNEQVVFVVDEYGSLQGMVTLHDLLEAMAGEFATAEGEAYVIIRDDGSLLLDGLLSTPDLKDCLGLNQLPEEGSYQTLNGLILNLMDKVPKSGDKLHLPGWVLEVVDMDGHRVDKVLASRVVAPDDDDG